MAPSTALEAPAPATTFHRFLELPTELKLEVLRHVQVSETGLIRVRRNEPVLPSRLSMALTSKAMRAFSYSVYYSENGFWLWNPNGAKLKVPVPKLIVGQHIRHIYLLIIVETRDGIDEGWDQVFGSGEDAVSIQWQRNLPGLKKFTLLVGVGRKSWSSCWQVDIQALEENLGARSVLLKPKYVKVNVRGVRCRHSCTGQLRCKEAVERMLEEKIAWREDEDAGTGR